MIAVELERSGAMALRTVFLTIGASQDDAELDRALAISAELGAHLSVLVCGIAPPPPSSPYGVVSTDIWSGEIAQGQAAADARARSLADRLAREDVSTAVEAHYVDRATIATLAARFARYADLTIVTPQLKGFEALQTCVMDGALFESGRPILILPKGPADFSRARNVMIAWDASVEASKAVRDAIDILQAADEVRAVLIDPVPSFEGHGQEPGADLARYLGRHGIETIVDRLPRLGQDVADVLRRCADDHSVDLIVMGGFGHSRLRERIFGGTTTRMMKQTNVPVLMAH